MPMATLSKRIEFCASHRYHNDRWDAETNRAVFGACNNEPNHGHNYILELTVGGDVDQVTGMIINLYDLKRILLDVLEEFDHKNLNLDTPYFQITIPTTENLAWVLWDKFLERPETRNLKSLRLYETDDFCAEVTSDLPRPAHSAASGANKNPEACITKSYPLPVSCLPSIAAQTGDAVTFDVTIHGPIDPQTGRVTDIVELDNLIQSQFPAAGKVDQEKGSRTGFVGLEQSAKRLWDRLSPAIKQGTLSRVTVRTLRNGCVTYTGNRPAPSSMLS